jgi:hypothetical protein
VFAASRNQETFMARDGLGLDVVMTVVHHGSLTERRRAGQLTRQRQRSRDVLSALRRRESTVPYGIARRLTPEHARRRAALCSDAASACAGVVSSFVEGRVRVVQRSSLGATQLAVTARGRALLPARSPSCAHDA